MPATRRSFLASLAASPFFAQAPTTLPPWQAGYLDLHHISTGRGNCTLVIAPDGTTLMIDAGGQMPAGEQLKYFVPPYPDASRRPGEWMARYARRHLQQAQRDSLDHFFLTHFHSDHMGAIVPGLPKSAQGDYLLSGVTDIAEALPIAHLVDRGFPNYNYPTPLNDPATRNYRSFVQAAAARGARVEAFDVGSRTQFAALRDASRYLSFEVRNIAANGRVWTGEGVTARDTFPALNTLTPAQYPSENMCSAAIRIRYGAFDYYHGGDICDGSSYGEPAWRNVELAAARAAGAVDVALVSHHGYLDSTGPDVVRTLRPRAFILHAWDSAHPTMPALHNMLSTTLYPGPRDIFTTALKDEIRITLKRAEQLAASRGHVVVRVAPGGERYEIFITENLDESDRVLARFGPYATA